MNRPKVSIVIPTYNRAELLRECLQQALTVPRDSEIVILDNASKDDTPALIEQFASADGRIRTVRNETNIGMVPNFNKGMSEARGEYLCVVCDDDLILPGHTEKKAAILDRCPDISFVYGPWHMIDSRGASSGTPLGSGMLTYPYVGGRDEFGDLIQNNHIMMNGLLFRRSLFEELGGLDESPDIHPSPDWEMWLRYSYGRQTAYLPEPTCCVRFHETSNTVGGTGQGAFARARMNIWRRWLVERDPPIVLNENVWQRMRALWEQDLGYWFNQDCSQVLPFLDSFDRMKLENQRLHERRFVSVLTSSKSNASAIAECRTPAIRWTANYFDYSGYARLSRDAVLALDSAGTALSIEPEGGSQEFVDAELATKPALFQKWQRLRAASVSEEVSIYFGVPTWWNGTDAFARHREQRRSRPHVRAGEKDPKFVGIAMFETDRLPAGWAGACNGMDEVWVPSTFNRETFERAGVDPGKIRVIPFGIDANAYDPEAVAPLPCSHKKSFSFLSVFQWSRRKGWDVLLDAYFREFTCDDDVCLVIRAYPDGQGAEPIRDSIDRFIRERGFAQDRLPAVELIEGFVAEHDMPRLYRAADCFVLPTRGEGWGIPFMEAMASALPVIATGWSAHLDFMSAKNAYLIPVDCLEPVDPEQTARNAFYAEDHLWAEPNIEETGRLMRHVFDNREEARAKGQAAREHIQRRWSLQRTAEWISNRVRALVEPAEEAQAPSNPKSKIQNPKSHVSWSAPLFDPSGYAEEARNFLFALDGAGTEIVARDVRWSNRKAVIEASEERRLLFLASREARTGGVHVSHILPPHFTRRTDAVSNVGRTMFETDRLPEGWADACNAMDRIWVPSEFNRRTFTFAGVDPQKISVVPGTIDVDKYDPQLAPLRIEGARGYNFLSVFDWSLRKGWDVLVRGFVEEFGPEEDVALIIKTHSSLGYSLEQIIGQVSQFIQNELKRDPEHIPDIIFQETDLSSLQMPRLYQAADCFVMPSRGEGWGRPYMEAMTLGLPVIGTAWSGNTGFMNEQNSLLISCEVVDVPEAAWQETPTFRGHRWAEPDLGSLRQHMRHAFANRDAVRVTGAKARDHILTHYSYCRVAAIIQEEIRHALDLDMPRGGRLAA